MATIKPFDIAERMAITKLMGLVKTQANGLSEVPEETIRDEQFAVGYVTLDELNVLKNCVDRVLFLVNAENAKK